MIFLLSLLSSVLVNLGVAAEPTKTFKCTGHYGSYTCEHTLFLNECKNSIKLRWEPLKFPGTDAYKKARRTWCSVTWNAVESVEERKLPPENCEKVMSLMASALKGFPEIKWQDTACTHLGTPDGVLYTSQQWDTPTRPATPGGTAAVKKPSDHKDPSPVAIGLRDVRGCSLHNPFLKRDRLGANDQTPVSPERVKRVMRRTVKCPVLQANVHAWMRKFLASLNVKLEIKNELR